MITINKNNIEIKTKNTSLVIEIKSFDDNATPFILGREYLTLFYYGLSKNQPAFVPSNQKLNWSGSSNDYCYDLKMLNTFGDCNAVEGSILVENVDGSYVNRFFFKDAKIIKEEIKHNFPHSRNVSETLLVVEEDLEAGLVLETYYSLFNDSDVIAVKRKLINNNKKSIYIKNISSLQLSLNTNELNAYTYDGAWICERSRHKTNLTSGVFVNESVLFTSSHKHNPFIQIENKKDNLVYSFNLIFSGNHKTFIDVDSVKEIGVISVGINSYCFSYRLFGGESFETPEAIMSVNSSLEEGSKTMRHFVNNHIINPKYLEERPILFNSWEGSVFDICDEKLMKMAELCKEVGIELFVVDDGWFGNRINDKQGLGDWYANKERFPEGFGNTANKIRKLGVDFGFWIEPEMIQIGSEIFKTHPEYACTVPFREPIERRHQLMIDMSNPEVIKFLFNSLSEVIKEVKPTYIKWDFNRNMSEAYSHYGTKSGELMFNYVYGSYKLMDKLTKAFPKIMFEGCSSGGGRFDLGIAYYMPQSWGSDNSNSYSRSFISCGTFAGYPQSTFGAHVSRDTHTIDGLPHVASLEDRFNLQCIGGFGYEFDITKLSKEDLDIVKSQVSFYKKHRKLIQFGNLEIIDNIFDNNDYLSYQISDDVHKNNILVVIQTKPGLNAKNWKLKGLDKNKKYKVSMREHMDGNNFDLPKIIYSGEELINVGIKLPSLDSSNKNNEFTGIFSRMLFIDEE